MHFARLDDFLTVSRITGPRHNLLQLLLAEGSQQQPICECLPPQGGCKHEVLDQSELVSSVLEGVEEANKRLGTSYSVTHIRYVENDTKPEVVYGYMAMKLLEHLHAGGVFVAGKNAL